MMQLASEERIREILTKTFGVDIRVIEIEDRRFSVTFEDDGEPSVVCMWDTLPEGHTLNGSSVSWVQKWCISSGDPLPAEYEMVVERARKQNG